MAGPGDADEILVVLTTVGNADEATRLARHLVEKRLAACVNILPQVRSVFRWEGAVQEESELLLLSKTTRARFAALAAGIREVHGYDVPEIVALTASEVGDAYAAWVRDSV